MICSSFDIDREDAACAFGVFRARGAALPAARGFLVGAGRLHHRCGSDVIDFAQLRLTRFPDRNEIIGGAPRAFLQRELNSRYI